MKRRPQIYIPRRALLAGMGAGAAGMFLRPMFASAQDAAPQRLLIVHRPCGTLPEDFFPQTGDATNFTLPRIIAPFEPVKSEMVIINETTCPRDMGWPGDQHSAGLITMMTGKRFIDIPGTDAGGDPNAKNITGADKSIDQILLEQSTMLQGTAVPSLQSTAYRPSSVGLPSFKVMSYSKSNGPLFAESRPDFLFSKLFAPAEASLSPEALARMRAQRQGVLDFALKDLNRLRGHVPASQLPKLDSHLEGLQQLQAKIQTDGTAPGAACDKPEQLVLPEAPGGVTIDEAQHLNAAKNQLGIISAAFKCDLTRVATFTFAHGNSDLRFSNVIDGFDYTNGHHNMSHDTGATDYQARTDLFYSEILSGFLQELKATPEGAGTMLDNTLVVYINECCIGNSHSIENMPTLMFGGKTLGLQTGQHIRFGGRYMNDIWAAVATAFGVPMTTFGDTDFSQGAVTGLFA
ncbi:MAG TPA: DUF1552 domain-containing protein [Polyangiaceae bacterium]|nr:DUF1552 domain-containing protein [Polyangiaceae bacterium]